MEPQAKQVQSSSRTEGASSSQGAEFTQGIPAPKDTAQAGGVLGFKTGTISCESKLKEEVAERRYFHQLLHKILKKHFLRSTFS